MTREDHDRFTKDHESCLQKLTVTGEDFDFLTTSWRCSFIETSTIHETRIRMAQAFGNPKEYNATHKKKYANAEYSDEDLNLILETMHKKARIWLESNDFITPTPAEPAHSSTRVEENPGLATIHELIKHQSERLDAAEERERVRDEKAEQRQRDIETREDKRRREAEEKEEKREAREDRKLKEQQAFFEKMFGMLKLSGSTGSGGPSGAVSASSASITTDIRVERPASGTPSTDVDHFPATTPVSSTNPSDTCLGTFPVSSGISSKGRVTFSRRSILREKAKNNVFDFSTLEDVPHQNPRRFNPDQTDCFSVFETTVCGYYSLLNKRKSYDYLCERLGQTGLELWDGRNKMGAFEYLNQRFLPTVKLLNISHFSKVCLVPKVFRGDAEKKVERVLRPFMVDYARVEEEWAKINTKLFRGKLEEHSVYSVEGFGSESDSDISGAITVAQRLKHLESQRIDEDTVAYEVFYTVAATVQPAGATNMLHKLQWDRHGSVSLGSFFEMILKLMKMEYRRESGDPTNHQATSGEKSRAVRHVYAYVKNSKDLSDLASLIHNNDVLAEVMINDAVKPVPTLEKILESFDTIQKKHVVITEISAVEKSNQNLRTATHPRELDHQISLSEVKAAVVSRNETDSTVKRKAVADGIDEVQSKRRSFIAPNFNGREGGRKKRFFQADRARFESKFRGQQPQEKLINLMKCSIAGEPTTEELDDIANCIAIRENPMCVEEELPSTDAEYRQNVNSYVQEHALMYNIHKVAKLIEVPVKLLTATRNGTVKAIVDCGAAVNCIRREVIYQAGLLSRLETCEQKQELYAVGNVIPIRNTIKLDIEIGSLRKDNVVFWVIPNNQRWESDCLLGMTLLDDIGFSQYCRSFWLNETGVQSQVYSKKSNQSIDQLFPKLTLV